MVSVNPVMTAQHRISIVNKYALLIFVLGASIYANVIAQEQNAPLLTDMVGKIQQLQSELTELRNQNELTQHELTTFKKNLDLQLRKLETKIDQSATTSTISPTPTVATDPRIEQLMGDIKRLQLNLKQTKNRLNKLTRVIETLKSTPSQTPSSHTIEIEQTKIPQPEETAPAVKDKVTPIKPAEPPNMEQTKIPQPEETAPAVKDQVTPIKPAEPPNMEQTKIPQPEETTPAIKDKVTPIKPAGPPNKEEYTAYSRAMNALERADYTRLRDNLTRFLQDYPAGDYADDANYWVAESYYDEGNLELAESYFMQLLENYKKSEKRESALLKIAYIRLNNKQWDAARKVLELLADEAKDKQIRELATEQLKQLESKGR